MRVDGGMMLLAAIVTAYVLGYLVTWRKLYAHQENWFGDDLPAIFLFSLFWPVLVAGYLPVKFWKKVMMAPTNGQKAAQQRAAERAAQLVLAEAKQSAGYILTEDETALIKETRRLEALRKLAEDATRRGRY